MPTVAPLDLDEHCVFAGFCEDVPLFAVASGEVHRLDHGHHHHEQHDGLLAATLSQDGKKLLTSGEDGRVCSLTKSGESTELASIGSKWISTLASGPQDAIGFATGRTAYVLLKDGTLREFNEERSVEGMAFAPKGMRIAFARYNGVSLNWVNNKTESNNLHWDGAHLDVMFSPAGKFLVTTMQENALHGWKLDGKNSDEDRHMKMTGYPAKIKSWSWSVKGKWLVTSGAHSAIAWPFSGKDGPMGKAPMELATRGDTMVTCVACHPQEDVVAIGFADGMILASRFEDSKEAVLRRGGNSAISSMGWQSDGRLLAFGSEKGECGVVDIAG
ncbi:WD40 repeat domain-containing protein [Lentilitoribacter sp. Alg239-R112]|jgi:WD40 repeat protein|uniref:WD40 repeat domain-containing protein n=1 Tax=Lentilitoribacter sp. Alg239-R112 TaxID=2305987 RepID=UPI0013A6B14D|nr:WD40 repeat domain-containing protein [Lentilitoribacter sp. Alg239-R112]